MNLQGLKIKKLFGEFDYEIALNQEYGITILSGPNGYGKTTILNILYNLFNQRFDFFRELNFGNIVVNFLGERQLNISKKNGQPKNVQTIQIINGQQIVVAQSKPNIDIHIDLIQERICVEEFIYNADAEHKLIQGLSRIFPIQQIASDLFTDKRTGQNLSLKDFLEINIDSMPQKTISLIDATKPTDKRNTQISNLLNSVSIYIIREQRLLKQNTQSFQTTNKNLQNFSNTINIYANELKNKISQKLAEAFQIAQERDSTFPKRLIDYKDALPEQIFKDRLKSLTDKQEQLQSFKISTSIQGFTAYEGENQRVLSVYLEDAENKISVFDDLLKRLNLFVELLEEKQFTLKSIKINSNQGVFITTKNGQPLNLTDLSSGEQEELVLLYELLFRVQPNTLVLLDEPETSLHVVWQKTFIKDLVKIARVQNISFLLATHSPQIINGRWDLTTDLHDLYESMNK
ncbi:hypothetical protein FACS1894190_08160 [Spirochaetia bacterium]|nr:hypothetical protein FACS1894190_08160 [Spirochaetia bacterium]